jgi:proliferating cell nuclear antigen
LKLVSIEGDLLGIPDTEYQAIIQMPSAQFQKICRDLSAMGETVLITASKSGVKFAVSGTELNGSITVRQNAAVDKVSYPI